MMRRVRRDLWVDFNEVGDDSRVCTLLKFARPGASISVGAKIAVGDDEGNRCQAQVVGIDDGLVELVVDGSTFERPRDSEHPSLLVN